jgi:hypothetical protein
VVREEETAFTAQGSLAEAVNERIGDFALNEIHDG